MKRNIHKYILLVVLGLLGVSLGVFLCAHVVVHLLWLHSQGAVHTVIRTVLIQWLSIPIFGMIMGLLSLVQVWYGSEKEWSNHRYLLFKTTAIIILSMIAEYFLRISHSLILLLLGGFTNIIDPLTHLDVSFYLFWLPFFKKISIFLIFYSILLVFSRLIYPTSKKYLGFFDKIVLIQGLFFAAILAIILRFESIKYSVENLYIGYLDIYGWLIPFVLSVLWLFFYALLLIFFIPFNSKRSAVCIVITGIYLVTLNIVWPPYLKRFVYEPNQSVLQEKFAAIHAESTRKSFGINDLKKDNAFLFSKKDLPEIIRTNFWQDYPHFVKVIKHNQEILPIFKINDAHTLLLKDDQEQYNPYYIASRDIEEDPTDLWDIKHLRKIFGYGAVIGYANSFDGEGFPILVLKDLELTSHLANVSLKNPQIFFGESYENYALINTKMLLPNFQTSKSFLEQQKFDHITSIPMNMILRILMSIVLRDSKLLLTEYFTPDTRLILVRKPTIIAKTILSEFHYSKPKLVYHNQELWWEMDGYSVSDQVVTAKKVQTPWGEYNWLKSPIKAYVSAYSGEVIFDITDASDPHARIVKKLYPKLFQKTLDLPAESYLYPKDLFDVQSQLLGFYHELNSSNFYAGLNKRQISQKFNSEEKESIKQRLLLQQNKIAYQRSYTPLGKNIFSAQLTAYIDDNREKQMHLYEAPAQLGVPGLAQAESFLNQDPDFSRLATLWGQRGSLISGSETSFYPLQDGGIYFKTIFLESESISIPLATRFAFIENTTAGLGTTIEELVQKAFAVLLSEQKSTLSDEQQVRAMLVELYQYYLDAEKERVNGNTQEYQKNVDKIGVTLQKLNL